ncbi:MAG TPA: DUF2313 domain-containing protein [Oscillospiraceae bacterium]|nr:DUF2313 domain-containing protein [Oscillospiraceae bacterium]
MGYADYLRGLLAPLGVYRLDGGFSGGEIEALGEAFDALAEELEDAMTQALVPTATDEGLEAWETLFSHPPAAADIKARRAAVAALLRMAGPCTASAADDAVKGCGIAAAVTEDGPNAVAVSFPETGGVPENFAALQKRIEAILPAHVALRYVFRYITWAMLEAQFASWTALEAGAPSWEALERMVME